MQGRHECVQASREVTSEGLPADQQPIVDNLLDELSTIVAGGALPTVLRALIKTATEFVVCNTFRASEGGSSAASAPAAGGNSSKAGGAGPSMSASLDASILSTTSSVVSAADDPAPAAAAAPPTAMSNHKSKVILRMRQVVRCMFYRDGDLIWCLSSHAAMKELCSIVFTADQLTGAGV